MKAIVNRETAERMLADEELQTNVTMQISKLKKDMNNNQEMMSLVDSVDQLETKIDQHFDALQLKFKNSQIENEALIDELQTLVNQQNDQLGLVNQQLVDIQEEMQQNAYGTGGFGSDNRNKRRQDNSVLDTEGQQRVQTPLDDVNNAQRR